ncbi:hypothetical protein J2S74_000856 [Evansella vedderi]|uniref:Intracellular proteinase inhibitor BsuPI domain-containing protein n=1 Tax=Evansella vedderi TaxID=38282 RepID=A0ABT9ZQG5_9BACI|nr:BsuPI-related putative proteinase inhibitor [Evansella vedderi]MDQ0253484.1 hypothetical protein [Evansella vedderi]
MKKLLYLFILGLFLTGCGTGNGDNQTGDEVTTGEGGNNAGNGAVTGELVPSIMEDGELIFVYTVSNQTEEEVTLEFSTSQRYDFSVETKDGEQVFLFSSVAMFLQVEGEEVLQPGDELVYEINLKEFQLDEELEPGDYELKAWMTPKEGSMSEVSMDFTVE